MVLVAAEIVERRRGAALADGLAEIAVEVESTADALGGEVRPCEDAVRTPDLDDTELGLLAELRRDRSRKRPRNPKPAAVEKLRAEDAADVLRQARARVDERLSFQRPAEHPAETDPADDQDHGAGREKNAHERDRAPERPSWIRAMACRSPGHGSSVVCIGRGERALEHPS